MGKSHRGEFNQNKYKEKDYIRQARKQKEKLERGNNKERKQEDDYNNF